MSKEIELIKCIISEIDDNLYSDFGGNPCIRNTSNLKKLLLALDTPEVRHFFENCNNQAQQIAEIESKLTEKEKECQDNLHHAEFWQSSYKRCRDRENQAKLDFAIEKLKEVKKLFEEKYSYDVEESDFAVIYETDVDEIIDQQIAELKGGK